MSSPRPSEVGVFAAPLTLGTSTEGIVPLVEEAGVGDLLLVVNGGAPIRVLSCILQAHVPYFADLYSMGCTEQDSGQVEFEFEAAERQHVVDILRCAYGGELQIEIDTLSAHYEVARYWRMGGLVARLSHAAETLIDTPEKLHRARIIDSMLLDRIASRIRIYSDYACALIHWGLRHDALELACQAARGLFAPHALRIAQYVPKGDLRAAVCEAAVLSLYFMGLDTQASAGCRGALCALRASAKGKLPGLGLLQADRPGALMLRFSSGESVPVGIALSADLSGESLAVDVDTLAGLFRSEVLPCSEERLLSQCCRLLKRTPVSAIPEVRQMIASCVRLGLVPDRCLYEAREYLPNDLLCSLLFQRHCGYGYYVSEPRRCIPARIVLAAGACAAAAHGILARDGLDVCIKGKHSHLSGVYERQESEVREQPYWRQLYGRGLLYKGGPCLRCSQTSGDLQWAFGNTQEHMVDGAALVRGTLGWRPQGAINWMEWVDQKWQKCEVQIQPRVALRPGIRVELLHSGRWCPGRVEQVLEQGYNTGEVTVVTDDGRSITGFELCVREPTDQSARAAVQGATAGSADYHDEAEPTVLQYVPVHASDPMARHRGDAKYAAVLACIEELVGCESG
eukprot:TRINITY_DN3383_c0_g1_i1.p1 TRINITY_DN3383_c0_g1~~TRINITY_DN3383_c0_g1_i1.p1  ORF type:complete len:626 (+),score=38.56 TRINITY_DN3383_c0_g1_i1:85-1962(+)